MGQSVASVLMELSGRGYNIVMGSELMGTDSDSDRNEGLDVIYHDTILPNSDIRSAKVQPAAEKMPEQIREMKRLYEYGRASVEARAKNFYRQAVFMKDYEDDVPWSGDFQCYYPTYHDLNDKQLRGYFTWRTHVRRGDYQPVPISAAYIYIYELLNSIGGATPEECLDKLMEFRKGFIDAGFGNDEMRRNLCRWILEYAVIHDMPLERVQQVADPDLIRRDMAISVLKNAEFHSDAEVFEALSYFGANKIQKSPVITNNLETGVHLFCEVWRSACKNNIQEQSLFSLCFGEKTEHRWYPLSNAVCCDSVRPDYQNLIFDYGHTGSNGPKYREYVLNDARRYYCKDGAWYVEAYEKLYYDRRRLLELIRRADEKLRKYFKTGRYLKEDPAGSWADPYIDTVIESDRRAQIEASRPKIKIDLSGLDRIREDAAQTRDSLLTDDELSEQNGLPSDNVYELNEQDVSLSDKVYELSEQDSSCSDEIEDEEASMLDNIELPLDDTETKIVKILLDGDDPSDILKGCHMMPSIAADQISEKLFDEIGDNVIVCEDGRLELVEDYVDDVRLLLEG